MLVKKHATKDEKKLRTMAVMLSWGIYGASVEWRRSTQKVAPEEFIKSAIPFIMKGIHF